MLSLIKPEYFWRPAQIARRLRFRSSNELCLLRLPHGTIYARPSDMIGRAIATHGVYDLTVTETILRLTHPGDVILDVGANVGYTAMLFALAAGRTGAVTAFEPNPEILQILWKNIDHFASPLVAPIKVEAVALSDHDGDAMLRVPSEDNSGSGSLALTNGRGIVVTAQRLDSLDINRADIIKIDVEGYEAQVFAGAERLLSTKPPRDIIFEELAAYPAPSHLALERYGYKIFRLSRSLWRPLLAAPVTPPFPEYMPSNFLATMDVPGARARFASFGWRSLSPNRPG